MKWKAGVRELFAKLYVIYNKIDTLDNMIQLEVDIEKCRQEREALINVRDKIVKQIKEID